MYNYEQEYQEVVQESQVILNKAKQDYSAMKERLNEKTLQEEGQKLLDVTNDKLLEVKAQFLVKAQSGLEASIKEIMDNREKANRNKTKEDLILAQLQYQQQVQQVEAELIMSNEEQYTQILQGIDNENVFKVAKAKAYSMAQNKKAIQAAQFVDKELNDINVALKQLKIMDMQMFTPILPISVTNVDEYITGNLVSDTFFK